LEKWVSKMPSIRINSHKIGNPPNESAAASSVTVCRPPFSAKTQQEQLDVINSVGGITGHRRTLNSCTQIEKTDDTFSGIQFFQRSSILGTEGGELWQNDSRFRIYANTKAILIDSSAFVIGANLCRKRAIRSSTKIGR